MCVYLLLSSWLSSTATFVSPKSRWRVIHSKGATSTLGHPNGSIAQDWNGWHLRRRGAQRQGVHFSTKMYPKFEKSPETEWHCLPVFLAKSLTGSYFQVVHPFQNTGGSICKFISLNLWNSPTLPKMPVEIEPETNKGCPKCFSGNSQRLHVDESRLPKRPCSSRAFLWKMIRNLGKQLVVLFFLWEKVGTKQNS